MNKIPVFQGSCTAIVTPFCEKGIDYERLQKQLDFQLDGGTAAIVVCGTTGENATLSQDEHNELVRFTVNNCKGRMKVIVGVGGNNTVAALRKAENAKAVGADAILMVTPYYNKTSQKGLIEHFSYVADRVEIPMILYNVPSRTGIGITSLRRRAASVERERRQHRAHDGAGGAGSHFCGKQHRAGDGGEPLRALPLGGLSRGGCAVQQVREAICRALYRDQSHAGEGRHGDAWDGQRDAAAAADADFRWAPGGAESSSGRAGAAEKLKRKQPGKPGCFFMGG